MRLLTEITKNFKLLFRNWTTLLLLILGPLLLILLVGYAFSGNTIHDIKIGVIGDLQIKGLSEEIGDIGELIEFNDLTQCIMMLERSEMHLCLEVESTGERETFSGDVTFYYDPTRKKVSLAVIDKIKEFFGLKAEEISILSAKTLLEDIQGLVKFIKDSRGDIDGIQNQSLQIRADLVERKSQLQAINATFTPSYRRIRASYEKISPSIKKAENATNQFITTGNNAQQTINTLIGLTGPLAAMTTTINDTAAKVNSVIPGLVPQNLTDEYITKLDEFNKQLIILNQSLSTIISSTNSSMKEIITIHSELEGIIKQLDTMVALLEFEIEQTDRYIHLIDDSNIKLEAIGKEIDEKTAELDKINPGLAEKLIKPITQEFESIIDDPPSVQAVFPILLSAMILFISLLFSNIVSLLEIYNKAYIRNILAPVNDLMFMIGLIITNFFVVFFQVIVLLMVAQTRFGVDIIGHAGDVMIVSIVMITIFVFLGMIIANITKSVQSSILLTTFTALVFFLFSNIVSVLEMMPKPAAFAASLNPVVISNEMLRRILFFGQGIMDMPAQFGILLFYTAAFLMILTIVTKRKNQERF